MINNYILNTELIQSTMMEKGLTLNQLAEMSGFTARRLKRYVYGTFVQHTPLPIALAFRKFLGIKLEDMLIDITDDKKDGK